MPKILIGTASWTDKSLLQSGFYPKGTNSAGERLRFYSERFPIVEVDSTYYFPPTERNSALWADRTPPHFTFHIKAYSLFTQHPTRTASLFGDIRETLGPQIAERPRLYAKDLPQLAIDEMWTRFADALMPLHSSGKLGLVHFQFPQWFTPNFRNRDYIIECKHRLEDYRIGVEFRNGLWLEPGTVDSTLELLEEHDIPFTNVDMPQGFRSSLPPTNFATTKDIAYVRFHGRNTKEWEGKHEIATPRFAYNYSDEELRGWVGPLHDLAGKVHEVHVLMNNCYSDWAVNNAKTLAAML